MDDSRRTQLQETTVPFLASLLGCSPDNAWVQPVTFQAFSDVKPKGKDPLAKILQGSLDELADKLEALNQSGAGIFVTVNGTDGKGRKKANVTQGRAWWADLDAKNAIHPFDFQSILDSVPLEPSMIVKTPGGLHLYWIAVEQFPFLDELRRIEHGGELKAIATALEPFGGDIKASTVERVLRMPGYLHQKAEPRMVELLKVGGPRYTCGQVREAFPPHVAAPSGPPLGPSCPENRVVVLERAGRYLDTIPGSIAGVGGNAEGGTKTFTDALKLITGFDLTEDEALALLMARYNPRCEPPWTDDELRHKVHDAWLKAQECACRGHLLDDHGRPWVPGFDWNERGLHFVKPTGATDADGHQELKRVWIAPPFTLPGLVRDLGSQGWRLLIAWNDLDGTPHEEALPFELLAGEGSELARTLAQGGMVLPPDPGLRRHLLRYLAEGAPKVVSRVRLVETLGWQGNAFILPNGEVIGQAGEPVRFAGELPGQARAVLGTLEGWKVGVARLALGNPRLAFALACAFAGPLLGLVRPDGGGGFNLMGSSSKGKSTCLEAAASMWGRPDPLPTWRATGNGLESIAASRNDAFLVLDELSQVDAKEAGSVAYMLANGSAKARMTKEGNARPMRQWRLVFLSTGEQGLEDKVNEDGRRVHAGQEVRVPDIPFPPGGMFENSHGMATFGEFAEHLKTQARKHYGHAARAFLRGLCNMRQTDEAALVTRLKGQEAIWLASAVPEHADGQVRRVAGRFALVAVAGELARKLGVLPWPEGEASRAALACFQSWLERRGHIGASERERGLQGMVDFIALHGMSRFAAWHDTEAKPANMAGVRKAIEGEVVSSKYGPGTASREGWDFFVNPTGWKEACKGFDPRAVARDAVEEGLLVPGKDGKPSRKERTPHGQGRWYVVSGKALGGFRAEGAA